MRFATTLLSAAVFSALAMTASQASEPQATRLNAAPAAIGQAQGLIAQHAAQLQGADADRFEPRDVIVDQDGSEHVRFERSYNGLRVIGGDVVVQARKGQLASAALTLATRDRPSLTPRIDAGTAAVEAGARFGGRVDRTDNAGLVIYARGAKPVLAYEVRLQGEPGNDHSGEVLYYVDATDGRVLDVQDQWQTAAAVGSGRSLLYGTFSIGTDQTASNSFRLVDTTRGSGSVYDAANRQTTSGATLFTDTDNTWGNNAVSDRATVAVDIHYGVGVTWDYYKNVHGRNGIFNDGQGVRSYAHFNFGAQGGPNGGVNAGWNPSGRYMSYGDGDSSRGYLPLVAIDVAGHEMSHGVTQATAGLAYSGDAGGLNEATSDIFGTLVEFYASNSQDPGDYLMGEKTRTDGKPLRYMYKPDLDGRSFSCYPSGGFSTTNPAHNPHYTSGVGNHFFYLLAEGAKVPAGANVTAAQLVCNSDTALTGIGRDKAAKIWYRALTTKFTSNTTYPQARARTLTAASELYGANSPEYAAVQRAWSAVSVN